MDVWDRDDLVHKNVLWCVSPTIAKQAFLCALQCWCESPWDSSHLLLVPRILLRDFGRVSKSFCYVGQSWTLSVGVEVVVPFVLFYLPPFNRRMSFNLQNQRATSDKPPPPRVPQHVERELLAMRGMS